LIGQARELYTDEPFGVELEETVYALDSTTIDLCLSLFPWARFRRRKGAVKLHTLVDLRGNIPTFVRITHGKTSDVTVLDHLPIEPGAFYVMDRGYVDFRRLYRFTACSAFFVTRAKRGLDYPRRSRRRVDKTTGLRSDQTIVLVGPKTSRLYPDALRRVVFYDAENDRRLVFLTNNFTLPALTIAKLYKCRWQVELFFKWIKQNLHIKSFYGTSDNAVRVQVWIAISVYVLVAIVRKELRVERSLSAILQILSLTLFEKTPIFQALSESKSQDPEPPFSNQLNLFDL
jgi:IS4 transposase